MKVPQVKPDWETGIYIGNGVVAKPEPTEAPTEYGDGLRDDPKADKEHNGYFTKPG